MQLAESILVKYTFAHLYLKILMQNESKQFIQRGSSVVIVYLLALHLLLLCISAMEQILQHLSGKECYLDEFLVIEHMAHNI